MAVGVQISGLRKVTSTLRKVDQDAPKAIGRMHKSFAEDVARLARSYASVRPRRTPMGHIERTITARGSTRGASIAAGGVRAPDVFVQEFGGKVPLFGDRTRRFLVRTRKKDGYFMFPAVKDSRQRIESVYLPALERTIRQAER